VAEMAKGFAEEFGAREWAYLAGLWHDLGKFQEMFYLINAENGKKCLKMGQIIHV
jgi:CRISPR-associated endonuclease/helicase Cas3